MMELVAKSSGNEVQYKLLLDPLAHTHTQKHTNICCAVLYSNLRQIQDYLHMHPIQM